MTTKKARLEPLGTQALRLLLIVGLIGGVMLTAVPVPPALAAVPANDDLANATSISPTPFTSTIVQADMLSATTQFPDELAVATCGSPSGNVYSVWYKLAPSSNGWLTVDTLGSGSSYDTVLEVYTTMVVAPTFADLTEVACNDDATGGEQNSEVTVQVSTAYTYYVVARNYGGKSPTSNLVVSASFSTQQVIYVNGSTGNDSNPGSASLPVKTIQTGVGKVSAGGVVSITTGIYAESVTITKTLTLTSTAPVTATSFTLTNGAVLATGTGGVTAPTVNVNQVGAVGAKIQDGILLVSTGGTTNVGSGTYTETVTINKSLTLQGSPGATTVRAPSSNVVTVSGGTATISGFTIRDGITGTLVAGGSGHVITNNNIISNTAAGLNNATGATVSAINNWWGSNTGPTHASNPGGVGSTIVDSNNVTFSPWCTAPVPTCTPRAGIPTQLIYTTQPGNSQSGVPFPTQPVLRAQDASGNIGINFNGPVTMTIGSNPGGGALSGTNPVTAVNGIITFTNLSISQPGLGYTLIASATFPSGLVTATSAPFDIYNNPPTAVNDTPTVLEDSGANTIDVLANDTDPDLDPLRIRTALAPANGSLITSTTLVTYTPNANFFGTDVFTYTMSDIYNSGVSTATVSVTVSPVNDAPSFTKGPDQSVAEDAGAQTVVGWATNVNSGPANESGQTVTFQVSNNNPSLFSSPPTITVGGPTYPTTGTLSYTPAPDAFGSAAVFVYLSDDGGTANGGVNTSITQTFTITVTPVNDPPSFTAGGNITVTEDSGAYSALWATSVVPGPSNEFSQTVTFVVTNTNPSLFSAPPTLTVPGPAYPTTGDLSFTPAPNMYGTATVFVTLRDNGGGSSTSGTQTFTITVTPVNDSPVAVDDTAVVNEDSVVAIFVLTNDNAANPDAGEPLSVTAAGPASFGTVLAGTTVVTYTPSADFFGTDVFTYTVTDGALAATATVTVIVNPVNDVPSFTKGPDQSVLEDAGAQTVSGWATSISPGPPNESGQSVSFNVVSNTNSGLFSVQPSVSPTGTLSYTPAPNAFGSATIGLRLQDTGGTAYGGVDTSATQSFTITVTPVNDAPTFGNGGNQSVPEDSGAQTVAGWAAPVSPGPFEMTQTVTFTVTNSNNPLFSAQPGINAAGTLTYTPAANAFGSATVFVTLTDDGGTTNGGVDTSPTQTFTITVRPVNDPPSFVISSTYTVAEDSGLRFVLNWATSISTGPANEAGQTVTFTLTNNNNPLFSLQPAIDASGTLSFTTAPNANGVATVTVTLRDSGGTLDGGVDTSAAQFTINVTPVNDAPVAVNDTPTVLEDSGANTINVMTNDNAANPDAGEALTITAVTNGVNGGIASIVNPSATVGYAPPPNYFGPDSFTYTITDGPLTATATVSVTVLPVNDPPTFAKGPDQTVPEDSGAQTVSGWATGMSPGPANEAGQVLTFTLANTNNALFSVQPAVNATTGNLTFTPAPNANGSATVFVTLRDSGGTANGGQDTSATQSFVITVTPVNDPPTAVNDSASVTQNSGPNAISVLANDTAAPDVGETLLITSVTQGANGTVAITGGGTGLTYSPNFGYAGPDSFTYTISDGNGGTATATVTVTVTTGAAGVIPVLYLPLVMNNAAGGMPDLVGSFSLNPANPSAGQPVQVTAVITNQGSAAAGPFWADFYINPSTAPTGPNTPWNVVCGMTPCYGIAWYVPTTLSPGQSIVLTSSPGGPCAPPTPGGATAGGYCDANTIWPGAFASGTKDLYLFVDSWNPGVATGAVLEANEANDRAESHFLSPLAGTEALSLTDQRRPEDLPARPVPTEN